MSVAKNIFMVITSPKLGWEGVNESVTATARVLSSGFYPVLAILAIASFVPYIYTPTDWPLSKLLIHAIIEFTSFFASYFLISYLLGGFYPRLVKTPSATTRLNNFIIYNLIYLALLEICNNLLDNAFSPLYFMLLYVCVLVNKGAIHYLGMSNDKKLTKFVLVASALLILLPIIIRYLLGFMMS
ncbi:MAG: hypothetical protein II592_02880 [Muribaculaceae bacterium]|nr:hypothetical protein [Muribaculaceae bacterium]